MDPPTYVSREPSAQATETAEPEPNSTNPTGTGTAGTPKTPRTRAKFDNAENLPDKDAELSQEQMQKLIYQKPPVRKEYTRYFNRTRGHIRKEFFHLIFERLPTGQLRHPETIIASNVVHWQNTLRHFEDPDRYDAKGREKEPKGKSRASTEEPTKKRKRESSKSSVQQLQVTDDEAGESHAEEEPLPAPRAKPSSNSAPATREEAVPTHEVDGRSTTADEPVGPASPVPTERASPERTVEFPVRDDVDDFKSPIDEPEDGRLDPEHEHERGSVISDLFPPVQAQAQITSSPTIRSIEHTAATGRDHYDDEPMNEDDELHDPTGQAVQLAQDALRAATVSEEAPVRQYLSTDLGHFVSKFEAGDLNLMDADDLAGFTQWINGEIHKLNLNSIQAPVVGKSHQYRHCVNDLMVRLLTLQKACFNLDEQLRKDQAREE